MERGGGVLEVVETGGSVAETEGSSLMAGAAICAGPEQGLSPWALSMH